MKITIFNLGEIHFLSRKTAVLQVLQQKGGYLKAIKYCCVNYKWTIVRSRNYVHSLLEKQ